MHEIFSIFDEIISFAADLGTVQHASVSADAGNTEISFRIADRRGYDQCANRSLLYTETSGSRQRRTDRSSLLWQER
jgi:hypothetical protein